MVGSNVLCNEVDLSLAVCGEVLSELLVTTLLISILVGAGVLFSLVLKVIVWSLANVPFDELRTSVDAGVELFMELD